MANYFQSVRRRRGTNKALIALAHKLVRIIYTLFTRQEKFDFTKLLSSPVSSAPAPETPAQPLPEMSELSSNLALMVNLGEDNDLPEAFPTEIGSASSSLETLSPPPNPSPSISQEVLESSRTNSVLAPKKRHSVKTSAKEERPTTTEPVARRRGRPRKQQTET